MNLNKKERILPGTIIILMDQTLNNLDYGHYPNAFTVVLIGAFLSQSHTFDISKISIDLHNL